MADRTITFEIQAKNHMSRTPNRFIAITRARCIARYRLHSIPGRREELAQQTLLVTEPGTPDREYPGKVISFGYTLGLMRIRQHGGERNREWVEVCDIQLRDGWLDEVYAFLDPFFEYVPHVLEGRTEHPRPRRSDWRDRIDPYQP